MHIDLILVARSFMFRVIFLWSKCPGLKNGILLMGKREQRNNLYI